MGLGANIDINTLAGDGIAGVEDIFFLR